jgi:hypothetical protein
MLASGRAPDPVGGLHVRHHQPRCRQGLRAAITCGVQDHRHGARAAPGFARSVCRRRLPSASCSCAQRVDLLRLWICCDCGSGGGVELTGCGAPRRSVRTQHQRLLVLPAGGRDPPVARPSLHGEQRTARGGWVHVHRPGADGRQHLRVVRTHRFVKLVYHHQPRPDGWQRVRLVNPPSAPPLHTAVVSGSNCPIYVPHMCYNQPWKV